LHGVGRQAGYQATQTMQEIVWPPLHGTQLYNAVFVSAAVFTSVQQRSTYVSGLGFFCTLSARQQQ